MSAVRYSESCRTQVSYVVTLTATGSANSHPIELPLKAAAVVCRQKMFGFTLWLSQRALTVIPVLSPIHVRSKERFVMPLRLSVQLFLSPCLQRNSEQKVCPDSEILGVWQTVCALPVLALVGTTCWLAVHVSADLVAFLQNDQLLNVLTGTEDKHFS
jgi:hypothetical protein